MKGEAAHVPIFLSANSVYEAINCSKASVFSTCLWDSKVKIATLWRDFMLKSHSAAAAGGTGERGMKGHSLKMKEAATFNEMTKS